MSNGAEGGVSLSFVEGADVERFSCGSKRAGKPVRVRIVEQALVRFACVACGAEIIADRAAYPDSNGTVTLRGIQCPYCRSSYTVGIQCPYYTAEPRKRCFFCQRPLGEDPVGDLQRWGGGDTGRAHAKCREEQRRLSAVYRK